MAAKSKIVIERFPVYKEKTDRISHYNYNWTVLDEKGRIWDEETESTRAATMRKAKTAPVVVRGRVVTP